MAKALIRKFNMEVRYRFMDGKKKQWTQFLELTCVVRLAFNLSMLLRVSQGFIAWQNLTHMRENVLFKIPNLRLFNPQ